MTVLHTFEKATLNEVCPAGEAWMCEVKKGQYFRIIDLEGNQAVDTLFISAENPEEFCVSSFPRVWPATSHLM